jgi:hypothetical protein
MLGEVGGVVDAAARALVRLVRMKVDAARARKDKVGVVRLR